MSRAKVWRTWLIALSLPVIAGSVTIQPNWLASASTQTLLSDQQVGELQRAVTTNPDVFGGLWGDPRSHVVTINLNPGFVNEARRAAALGEIRVVGTNADPQAATVPKEWSVRLSSSGPSLATLESVMSKVTTAQPWATDASQHLISWYIDPKSQRVVIGLDQLTPRLESDAQAVFGDLAQLTLAERAKLLADRLADFQPYDGSDRIINGGGSCTAGFKVWQSEVSGIHHGMLTAGHCWSVNTVVQQGYYDINGNPHTTGKMGQVGSRSYGNNVTDAEFLDGDAVGTSLSIGVWVGGPTNPPAKSVSQGGTTFVGMSVCFDGSFTTENCQGVVDAVNVCQQFTPFYECHLDRAHSFDGSILADSGDSGGPVEKGDGSGGLIVYGTITGRLTDFSEYFYSDLGYELSALQVNLCPSGPGQC